MLWSDPFTVLLAAGGLGLCFLVRYLIYPALLSPLARVPAAHWSAPVSPIWILWIRFSSRENRTLLDAHQRLGPVIRVGPKQLSISDAESVRIVYQGGFEKTSWYSGFDNYGVPCMFSERPAKEHSIRKRMISNVYSKSYLQSSQASSDQARVILGQRLLPILLHSTIDSQVPHGIDMYSTLMGATMDFIAAYCFGLEHGTNFLQNKGYREHWLQLYAARRGYSFFPQELPRLTWLCGWLGISLYPAWVDDSNEELRTFNKQLCDETLKDLRSKAQEQREGPEDSRDAVVASTLLAGLSKDREKRGDDSLFASVAHRDETLTVYSELLDHVLAGQETSGIALAYLSWRLSQSLQLQHELRAELLTLKPNMQLQENGSCSIPDSKALDALPLLHAVIMETLRLHAPIPGPEPRKTPKAGCRIGSYHIPGGVRVAALPFTLHRDETVFPDPERWDHTRWLASHTSEDSRKLMQRQFWAFGSGGRMCIGSNFALLEMKRITAAIYTNFTTHIVDDAGMPDAVDGYTAPPSNEQLYLRFERAS